MAILAAVALAVVSVWAADKTWTGADSANSSTTFFTKSGAGRLTINSAGHTFTGDVLIEGGEVILTQDNDVANVAHGALGNPRVPRTITVTNGATLTCVGKNPATGAGTSTQPILAELRVINSTLNLTTNFGNNFGNVYFDNATVNMNGGLSGASWREWGSICCENMTFRDSAGKGTSWTLAATKTGYAMGNNRDGLLLSKWYTSVLDVPDFRGDPNAASVVFNVPLILCVSSSTSNDGVNTRFIKKGAGMLSLEGNTRYSNYTGDCSVVEGVLRVSAAGYNNAASRRGFVASCLGNPNVPHTFFIGTNATISFQSSDSMTAVGCCNSIAIKVSNGTLKQGNNLVTTFGPLTLEDATLVFSGHSTSVDGREWGTFAFNGDVWFKKGTNTVYNLNVVDNSSYKMGVDGSGEQRYFIVDDLSGSDLADVNLYMPNLDNPPFWYPNFGSTPGCLGKAGAGTLALKGSAINSTFTGDVDVKGGVLRVDSGSAVVNRAYSPLGNPQTNRTIRIRDGGTLRYNTSDAFGQLSSDLSRVTTYVTDGGTLDLGIGFCNGLGNLSLTNGTLLYSRGMNGSRAWGVGGFAALFALTGTSAYDFPDYGSDAYCRFSLGYGTDCEKVSESLLKGKTEWHVADITADGNVDVTFRPLLQDIPDWAGRLDGSGKTVKFSCGLKKTGPGTLRLTNTNIYTGDTEVAEGALLVDSPSSMSLVTVKAGGLLGGGGTIPGVTIEKGGGFEALTGADSCLNVANLTLPEEGGVVNVSIVDGCDPNAVKRVFVHFLHLTGPFDSSKWAVTVNHRPVSQNQWKVVRKGNTLYVCRASLGTVIMLRG